MKNVTLFAFAAVAAVIFTACGGSGSGETKDTATVAADTVTVMDTTTAVTPVDTAAAADTAATK